MHDSANISAVWDFGDVVLKIKLFQTRKGCTREGVTLNWLANQKLSFAIPRVLHYSEDDDQSYLFSTRLPGITINSAWPSMDEDHRQYYVQQVVEICIQLSAHSSAEIGGVDGAQLADGWLDPVTFDFRPDTLLGNCAQLGMSSTLFHFSHNDLAPGNIIIDPNKKRLVGIIDWEMAGYVPREWISTKFGVSWGLDLEMMNVSGLSEADWRHRVHQALKEEGFSDVSDGWKKWYNERCALS
ncbi:kinase-like domain [Fusarium albosuccineum]|uniref:Kinase-like domain n=1 Tax=Fusarium albosuccineum TaxID=1237068 RepID=A0A8H4LJF4_9HYPO|nr:kinase-like domain [Fusarium albosuccineum]